LHRAVGGRIERLIGIPGGCQGTSFNLAIAYDAGDDEVGIVVEINLADRQIIGGVPVSIHLIEQF
jgi:hypothetical protein